ncbi:MAG: hypothetical protein AAGB93_14110 [Planctomycetota bacterium]
MRVPLDLALAAACGLAGFTANELAGAEGPPGFPSSASILEDRWPADWAASAEAAAASAAERGATVLVYARAGTFACRALEESAGADALVLERMRPFVPLALDLTGSGADRALARTLGIESVPALTTLGAEALHVALEHPRATVPRIGVRAVTGGLHEPFGLAHALLEAGGGEVDTFEAELGAIERALGGGDAAGAEAALQALVERGASPNDPPRRLERFVGALREPAIAAGPADAEGTLEAALLVEGDERVLYRGWSLLASVFELRARAAEGDAYRGVEEVRWGRRLRDASRRAWLSCPDAAVVPFGALLIERYAASETDLDSLDRRFCAAVARTLQGTAPDSPRVQRAVELATGLR